MTKIKKLSFIFIGLLVVSLVLFMLGQRKNNETASFDKLMFAVADTAQIQSFAIVSDQDSLWIQRGADQWQLNDQYKTDPQLIYLTQRIMQAVQAQRPVSQLSFEAIKTDLQRHGKRIVIQYLDGGQQIFYAGGNPAKTTAYFGNEDLTQIYLVAIPGYTSYLSGIFELTLDQWRDRVLFASSWRTIQNLSIDYVLPQTADLDIRFDRSFLNVTGIDQMDTAVLMNYLQPLEFFQLNDYLKKGAFPAYDSLLGVEPMAYLTLKDIDSDKDRVLKIFPIIPGEQFYLLTNQENEMIVVDQKRMESILTHPDYFKAK